MSTSIENQLAEAKSLHDKKLISELIYQEKQRHILGLQEQGTFL